MMGTTSMQSRHGILSVVLLSGLSFAPPSPAAEVAPQWRGMTCHCVNGTAGGVFCSLYRDGQLVQPQRFCTPTDPAHGNFKPKP